MRGAVVCRALLGGVFLAGCGGPSAAEWDQTQAEVARLKADLDAANRRHADDERNYQDAMAQMDDMKRKLAELGSTFTVPPREQPTAQPVLSAPPPPSGWVPLGTSENGKCLTDLSVRFDPAPNRAQSLGTSVFFKIAYRSKALCPNAAEKEEDDHDYVNCERRTLTTCDEIHYAWSGEPKSSPGCGREATVFPDTYGEVLWKHVCGQQ